MPDLNEDFINDEDNTESNNDASPSTGTLDGTTTTQQNTKTTENTTMSQEQTNTTTSTSTNPNDSTVEAESILDAGVEEGETAFEATNFSFADFAKMADIDLGSAFEGNNDIDDAPEVSLDLVLDGGSYIGQIEMDATNENSVTVLQVSKGGKQDFVVSQLNIAIKLTGQLKTDKDPEPKVTNKMLYVRLFLAWMDKETGEIKTNEKNETQLYRLASAWYAAKFNATKPAEEHITAVIAFKHLSKFSIFKVIMAVLHKDPEVELDTFMIVPVTRYTQQEQFLKKDGKIVLDSNDQPKVAYEAREVNDINYNAYKKMALANDLMEDLSSL